MSNKGIPKEKKNGPREIPEEKKWSNKNSKR